CSAAACSCHPRKGRPRPLPRRGAPSTIHHRGRAEDCGSSRDRIPRSWRLPRAICRVSSAVLSKTVAAGDGWFRAPKMTSCRFRLGHHQPPLYSQDGVKETPNGSRFADNAVEALCIYPYRTWIVLAQEGGMVFGFPGDGGGRVKSILNQSLARTWMSR